MYFRSISFIDLNTRVNLYLNDGNTLSDTIRRSDICGGYDMAEKNDDFEKEDIVEQNSEALNEEELHVFSITDEEDEEHHFALVSEFEDDGKNYWVCEELFFDEEDEVSVDEEAYVIFRAEEDDGNTFLFSLEDDEFEKASQKWNELCDAMIDEDE